MVKKILNCIYWLLIIALIGVLIYVYNTKFFNDYLKTMKRPVSSFSRSEEYPEFLENTKEITSYKIQSDDYNNALFYKSLKVKKDTPYKVVCYVKTENVEYVINDEYKDHGIDYRGGANISLYGENDRSEAIYGTNDWTKLEFMFDSRDKEEVEIAFRLGTDMCDSKGTAYFSNIKVYEGNRDETDRKINFGVFVFQNLDINVDGKQFNEYMTEDDKKLLRQDVDNFKSSIEKMTRGKIKPNVITKYFSDPVTKVSFDKDNGYYLDVYDVYELIDNELNSYTYDHIFFVFKSDDLNKGNELKTNETDWVGLRRNVL